MPAISSIIISHIISRLSKSSVLTVGTMLIRSISLSGENMYSSPITSFVALSSALTVSLSVRKASNELMKA